jgi:hypothetical protein
MQPGLRPRRWTIVPIIKTMAKARIILKFVASTPLSVARYCTGPIELATERWFGILQIRPCVKESNFLHRWSLKALEIKLLRKLCWRL